MAYFVKLENNIVTNGIVISDEVCGEPTNTFPETEPLGQAFIADILEFTGLWIQTSYEGLFRNCYAGKSYTFLPNAGEYGEFHAPPAPPYVPPVE